MDGSAAARAIPYSPFPIPGAYRGANLTAPSTRTVLPFM